MNFGLEQSVRRTQAAWWEWSVWLVGDPKELDQVQEVVYTLHPTFPRPVRRVYDRRTGFKLESAGWGEFMIFATVKIANGDELILRHWLSLASPGSPEESHGESGLRVFLSSGAADESFAGDLQSSLENKDIEVLRTDDARSTNLPFSVWLNKTASTVSAAIAIISDKKSPWVKDEIAEFRKCKIKIVPVLIGRAQVAPEIADLAALRSQGSALEVASIANRIRDVLRAGESPPPMILSTNERVVSYDEVYSTILPYLTGQDKGTVEGENPSPATIAEISGGLEALRRAESSPDVMATASDRAASLMQTFIAQGPVAEGGGALVPKYGPADPRWALTVFRMVTTSLSGRADWRIADPSPMPIPNRLRAAVFGSWATGMYGAPVIAASISRDPAKFDLVMHLGDTYYSGTEKEVRERLLGMWPRVPGALNRALNGNHEMYSGGKAYFDIALPAFSQKASYFALQNDYWILAALDTAYAEHDLYGEQTEWLERLVANGGGRRLVLLTHHQPLSLFESQGPKLVSKLAPLLQDGRVFAWFWAHEHACIRYDPHPRWGYSGRCLGFGGVPYRRKAALTESDPNVHWVRLDGRSLIPGAVLLDGPNPHIAGHEQEYGPHGYAVLEFDGENFSESIMLADGTKVTGP